MPDGRDASQSTHPAVAGSVAPASACAIAIPAPSSGSTSDAVSWPTRATAGAIALPTAGVLGLAAWLEPSSEGLGTHTALGLPRCGWVAAADFPCPTCGMTTAFAHAADGRLVTAFMTQPAGAVLALVAAMTLIASLHTLLTGQSILPLVRPLLRPKGWTVFGLFVLAAWIFKIATHRGFL